MNACEPSHTQCLSNSHLAHMALGQNSHFPVAHMIQFPETKKMLVYACHVVGTFINPTLLCGEKPLYPKCVHNPD